MAHAQQATWYQVNYVQLRPELLTEYLEIQKNEVTPALQKAGVPWRSAWRTGEFGHTYERLFVTPIANFAEFDLGGPLGRVLDARKLERLQDRLRRCTAGRQSYAVRHRADLTVESESVVERSIALVTTLHVAPGRAAEWERFLGENLANFREADVMFGIYQRMFGPGPSVWQVVENLTSYGELERPRILARMLAEADTEASSLAGLLLSIERTVLVYDPDLSYMQIPPSTEDSGRTARPVVPPQP
jgi:hypothetical protein